MHIAFLTLFLGLVRGNQPVTLHAGSDVAVIDLLLDGVRVASVSGPAWTTTIDFGAALLPHHLEARGLGPDGSEIDHAEQWVNLPRPPAEVEIVAEGGAPGQPTAVRLSWRNLTGAAPTHTRLSLDGVPLALDAAGRAAVPVPTAGAARVLTAELSFADGSAARKDVVLTGDSASDVGTELTAVPIRTQRPAKPLAAKDLAGLFSAGGLPLAVRTVDREPAEIYLVVAPSFTRDVRTASGEVFHKSPLTFDSNARVRFVASSPRLFHTADGASEVFGISIDIPFDLRLLPSYNGLNSAPDQAPQLADAVAVAGLQALAHQTPRAVVLLLGSDPTDASVYAPATVRSYLASVGVPLFVWSLHQEEREPSAWGEVEDISAVWQLTRSYLELDNELERQQIVWLEGRYLPQAIALSPAAGRRADFELVTAPATGEGKTASPATMASAPPRSPAGE